MSLFASHKESLSKLVYSEYQKAIFQDVKDGLGHTIIEARAGSGKTSTLLEALKYISPDKKILVVAFNKKIAVELQERAPSYANLEICTLHSFGYRLIRQSLGKVKLDTEKAFKIIKKLLEPLKGNPKDKDDYETIFEMKKCVSLCKGLIVDTPAKIDDLMDEFDITQGSLSREDFIQNVIIALGECKKKKDTIDYDDMIYFPFVLNLPVDKYDCVLIDEVQDLNPAQVYLGIAACKKDGRITAFGDNFQVLYKFRGADLDAISNLQERLKAKILYLPISYRCGKSIVFRAQKMVPDIKYAPHAKDGQIIHITEGKLSELVKPGDFVVSRTNAPLIRICFNLWKKKIPANLKGKDLGPALNGLVKQSKKKTVKAFLAWLDSWGQQEIARLKKKNRDARTVIDKIECLNVLAEGKVTVDELVDTIKSLFENKTTDNIVSLYTIHGAKGLEAKRVFFLSYTMTFGHGKEELNAEYVAVTRAKDELLVSKI
jgi:DNA helicase-2/ATP-dependent DNA helicase PcrA